MSPELIAFLLVVIVGMAPITMAPRTASTWLAGLVGLGGAFGFLPLVVDGDEPANEVARWVVLVGAAATLHLAAVLSGRRESDEPVDRRSVLVPAALYGATFVLWLALELGGAVAWTRSAPTWAFVAAVGVSAVLLGARAAAMADARSTLGPIVAGLALVLVVGAAHVGRPGLVPSWAAVVSLVPLLAALAWEPMGDLLDRFGFSSPVRSAAGNRIASAELQTLLSEVAAADTAEEIVARIRTAVERRGAELRVVVAGPADAPLDELGPEPGREPLTIDPADPLYVAFRAGGVVTLDEIEPPEGSAPARAAVHRLSALEVEAATPVTVGDRFVGALLLRMGDSSPRDLLPWLCAIGAPIGLALEAHGVRVALRAAAVTAPANPIPVGVGEAPMHSHGIIGATPGIRGVIEQIERVAPTDAAVFIRGETGTGKERVVEAVHALSPRAERELVKIPCAALPEELLESELFGYEPGAFTGAVDRKEGRFEVADGGTLFFDDVDTLPQGVQAKLLRALQEGEVQRLGSNQVRKVDVRIVAATNRDLAADVEAGRFREDLYYRLNVVPIDIPPLRDRREDIPLLVEHFLETDGRRLGAAIEGIAAESLADLEAYEWPGNVRELRNVIERALVMHEGDVLHVAAPTPSEPTAGPDEADGLGKASLNELLRRYKTRLVTRALELSGGNQRQAAEMLGIHRPSLTRMVRELGLREATGQKTRRKSG